MSTADVKGGDVRRQAEDKFAKIIKRDAEVRAYQQRQWDAEAAKVARLRALRMARDAESHAAFAKTVRAAKAPKRRSTANATISTGKV